MQQLSAPGYDVGDNRAEYLSLIFQELLGDLGIIREHVTTLLEQSDQNEVASDMFTTVDQMDRLILLSKQLVRGNLPDSQTSDTKRPTTDIRPTIKEILRALSARDNRPMLEASMPDDLPKIPIDSAQFDALFQYMVENALLYTEPHGKLDTVVDHGDGEVSIRVIINGVPGTDDYLVNLFKPAPPQKDGLNIERIEIQAGLVLASEIAAANGGQIWAEDVPGRGAAICCRLPVRPPRRISEKAVRANSSRLLEADVRQNLGARPAKSRRNPDTVLVIDDDQDMARLLRHYLEGAGYVVQLSRDGAAGIKAAEEGHPDLILLDKHLPDMDGLDVAAQVREFSSIPIIMVTGDNERDVAGALEIGIDDYVSKPAKRDELLARVKANIRRDNIARQPFNNEYFVVGDLKIDLTRRVVTMNGQLVKLGKIQYRLLTLLAANAGHVLSHNQILESVWGPRYRDELDYLWTHVNRIRKKLGDNPRKPRYIINDQGVGYHMPKKLDISS